MAWNKVFTFAIAGVCLSLQNAVAFESTRDDGFLSVTTQRGALVDCKSQLGRGGWPAFRATYVERPWGGQTRLRIVPGGTVSQQDAEWINSCADQKLGRTTEVIARPTDQGNSFCPKHAPAIYGGTRYCLK